MNGEMFYLLGFLLVGIAVGQYSTQSAIALYEKKDFSRFDYAVLFLYVQDGSENNITLYKATYFPIVDDLTQISVPQCNIVVLTTQLNFNSRNHLLQFTDS
jgi:hypothetical protein